MSEIDLVIGALRALEAANDEEEAATERRRQAETRLAEVTATARRDKDTGFEADHNAKDLIVKAALAGELIPARRS